MTVAALRAVAPEPGDFALARQAAAGDVQAFERIMRRHNRMLYRCARSILHDDSEAEDCLQSAYLLAHRAMADFAGQSKLSTWLARIVINEALACRRRTARHGAVIPIGGTADLEEAAQSAASYGSATTGAGEPPGPEREAMRHELRTLIERRVDALPAAFRGVFVLRAIEELSVEETATLLDIPEATVRTRYFRARGLLREALAQDVDTALDGAFGFDGARCDRIVAAVLDRIDPRPPPAEPG